MGTISHYNNVIFHPAMHPVRLVNTKNEEFILRTQRAVMQCDALRLLGVYKAHIKTGGQVVFDAYAAHLAGLRAVFATVACSDFQKIERQIDVTTQEHIHNAVYVGIGREMAKIEADIVWDQRKKADKGYEARRLKGLGYNTSTKVLQFAADLQSQAFQAILFKASLGTFPEESVKQLILDHVRHDDCSKFHKQQVRQALGALFAELAIQTPLQLPHLETRANSHAEACERRGLLRVLTKAG